MSDDILIYGRTLEEHNHSLQRVLEALKNAGLTLNEKNVNLPWNKYSILDTFLAKMEYAPILRKLNASRMPKPLKMSKNYRVL